MLRREREIQKREEPSNVEYYLNRLTEVVVNLLRTKGEQYVEVPLIKFGIAPPAFDPRIPVDRLTAEEAAKLNAANRRNSLRLARGEIGPMSRRKRK